MVGRFTETATGTGYDTYLELDDGIIVETASVAEPLSTPMHDADTLTAVVIHGTHGWHSTRNGPDGQWNGIVWMATPSRMIAVSGTAPLDAVLDAATSLNTVTEQEWVATTGWNGG